MFERSAELESIRAPTLLIYGDGDSLTTPEIGRGLHERIAGSEFVVVPRSGHLINLEKPVEFEAALLPFLTKHRDLAR